VLTEIRHSLLECGQAAGRWVKTTQLESESNNDITLLIAKGRSLSSAVNIYKAIYSMLQVFDALKWHGARYMDKDTCKEIVLDWPMLWIAVNEMCNIICPIVMNIQDASQVLAENTELMVRCTSNSELQYMRLANNIRRPEQCNSDYSIDNYPARDSFEEPPEEEEQLPYVAGSESEKEKDDDNCSRRSDQSVLETSKKVRHQPTRPIRRPFGVGELLHKHRTSKSFKERQLILNPLFPRKS
jgi:hypothetical protein